MSFWTASKICLKGGKIFISKSLFVVERSWENMEKYFSVYVRCDWKATFQKFPIYPEIRNLSRRNIWKLQAAIACKPTTLLYHHSTTNIFLQFFKIFKTVSFQNTYWKLLLLLTTFSSQKVRCIWNSGQVEILSNPKFIVDKLWLLCWERFR